MKERHKTVSYLWINGKFLFISYIWFIKVRYIALTSLLLWKLWRLALLIICQPWPLRTVLECISATHFFSSAASVSIFPIEIFKSAFVEGFQAFKQLWGESRRYKLRFEAKKYMEIRQNCVLDDFNKVKNPEPLPLKQPNWKERRNVKLHRLWAKLRALSGARKTEWLEEKSLIYGGEQQINSKRAPAFVEREEPEGQPSLQHSTNQTCM